jgi:hypothetical protein
VVKGYCSHPPRVTVPEGFCAKDAAAIASQARGVITAKNNAAAEKTVPVVLKLIYAAALAGKRCVIVDIRKAPREFVMPFLLQLGFVVEPEGSFGLKVFWE